MTIMKRIASLLVLLLFVSTITYAQKVGKTAVNVKLVLHTTSCLEVKTDTVYEFTDVFVAGNGYKIISTRYATINDFNEYISDELGTDYNYTELSQEQERYLAKKGIYWVDKKVCGFTLKGYYNVTKQTRIAR